jgi:cytochrome c556
MRKAVLAASAVAMLLSGCGRSQPGQASKNQANTAASANGMVMLAAPPPRDQALKIMKIRHDGMEALGKAMKTLHRELDSSSPDINVIRAETSAMAMAGTKIPALFPQGTGPDVSKTRAKAEIWKQPDLFRKKSQDYLAAARAIDAAARSGDLNKVMALHDNVDKACKACHDPFRAPEH